jgi:drug/metabolite transporter (DMT)-like permease
MTVVLALFASFFIGISDFLGGTASRTRSPLETSVVLQLAALVTLVPIALLLGASDLTVHDAGLGAVSGLATSVAYVGFFHAIGRGRMSIVVPISAAVTALLPAIVGVAQGNALSTVALGGVLCALVAIPLVAYETDDGEDAVAGEWPAARQVIVSILCGCGFGVYFICVGHTHRSAGLWPTVANLAVAVAVTVPIAIRGNLMPTPGRASRVAIAGGVALGVADVALTTALQRGPLTVASVLGNLYPLVTIALGVTVLGERVRLWHAAGILLAVAGVAMIAAGQ